MVVGAASLLLVSEYDSQAQGIIPWRNKHQLKVVLHCDDSYLGVGAVVLGCPFAGVRALLP